MVTGMKPPVYLETTIPSYYTARPSRDIVVAGHQAVTQEWWETRLPQFSACVSQIVINEAGDGDPEAAKVRLAALTPFPLLELKDDMKLLARELFQAGPLPPKAAQDAVHIAIAAVHEVDFLVTWNCKHIANALMASKIRSICHAHGVECPIICTPDELM